jgi:hypothetical protein
MNPQEDTSGEDKPEPVSRLRGHMVDNPQPIYTLDSLEERLWVMAGERRRPKGMQELRDRMHRLIFHSLSGPIEFPHEAGILPEPSIREWMSRTFSQADAPQKEIQEADEMFSTLIDQDKRKELEEQMRIPLEGVSPFLVMLLQGNIAKINPAVRDELREEMQRSPDTAQALLRAFLLSAHDEAEQRQILDFARHPDAGSILEHYGTIVSNSLMYKLKLDELLKKIGNANHMLQLRYRKPHIRRAEVLLRTAINLVKDHSAPEEKVTLERALCLLRDSLWQESDKAQLLGDLLRIIPNDEWSQIPVEMLEQVEQMPPQLCTEIDDPALMRNVELLIRTSFPGYWSDFQEFLKAPNSYLSISHCGGKLISVLGGVHQGDGSLQIDWLAMNPQSDLRGLMHALVVRGVNQMKEILKPTSTQCVAKPFVISLAIAIEDLESVADKLCDEGGDKIYISCYSDPKEKGNYVSKSLSKTEVQELVGYMDANTLELADIKGKTCRVARVMFTQSDPTKNRKDLPESQASIFQWVEDLGREGWVLTRYVPLYTQPETYGGSFQVYGAIFERKAAPSIMPSAEPS